MADEKGGKITVGCKLPHGLVIQMERLQEDKAADGAMVRRYVPIGPKITLNGANTSRVIGGFGITEGVDADMFNDWLRREREAGAPMVVDGMIFTMGGRDKTEDAAKERSDIRTGFEAIDPAKPAPGIEAV